MASLEPCIFVVFGATGDLMRRKLIPVLYRLSLAKLMPAGCRILGVARTLDIDDAKYREWARDALNESGFKDPAQIEDWCNARVDYQSIGDGETSDYQVLNSRLEAIESEHQLPGNRVHYLALPPGAFPGTIAALGTAGLHTSPGWTRLVIEKPFGRDLASAQELNALIHTYFVEEQVYRIDHYLGKETVQNLLAFRFGNALFESSWNRDHIKSVQITVAETLGIETRAAYYEQAGALRDMVQNHLTQLLTLTAMEVPAAFEANSIRFEKVKVLRSLTPLTPAAVVFGQYAAGEVDAKKVAGYRQEPGVAADSKTETFVAMRLCVENWRWQGVPFYLRTGKRMPRRVTQIVIEFRTPPVALFRAMESCRPCTNVLTIALQPDEGFDLSFEVKAPGEPFLLQTEHMQFRYPSAFGELSAGYDTLLLDVIEGDQTLFVHADETEASWRFYSPLVAQPRPIQPYAAGSWGPTTETILAGDVGANWLTY
ncbi:MAG: glucose-6-phosphate dehydrogenase [Betaproteobacteria bacterium]